MNRVLPLPHRDTVNTVLATRQRALSLPLCAYLPVRLLLFFLSEGVYILFPYPGGVPGLLALRFCHLV